MALSRTVAKLVVRDCSDPGPGPASLRDAHRARCRIFVWSAPLVNRASGSDSNERYRGTRTAQHP